MFHTQIIFIFNIYLLILQQLTKLIYSMIKNLLPIKWLAVNILGLSLSLLGINGFAQNKKLDPRFDGIFNSKASKGKTPYFQQPSAQPLKLDEHLVVTPEGKKKMYSAIIYTKNADLLRKKGILIQAEFPQFVTALVDAESLKTLVNEPSVSSIKSVDYASPSNDISRAQSGASLLQDGALNNTKYTGKNVLVGVLDTGIDWKHPDFRDIDDNTKSRIYSIWDMSLTPTGDEKSPEGFNYGVEYTRQMIEDELDGTPADFVREKDDEGHGTHVAGTAAGNGAGLPSRRHKGFAPDAELVIVKGFVNGGISSTNTINALKYFELIAKKLGKPIVVNMSIGGHTNAHDGTTPEELALNKFVREKGHAVVVAAGNEYGQNLHTSVTLAPNETKSVTFTLSGDESQAEKTIAYLLFFGTEDNIVDINITAPDGKTYNYPNSRAVTHKIINNAFSLKGTNAPFEATQKRAFDLLLTRNEGHTDSPEGNYVINFTNKGDKNITLHGYKNTVSQWVATEWKNGDNQYIVGSPGSADGAITVGAYTTKVSVESRRGTSLINFPLVVQEDISDFSSEGPRTDGALKPDITAAGMFIVSSRANGTEGNYYLQNQGTSMASPAVAGTVALLFQQNPSLTTSKIKELITSTANKDEKTTNQPNARWGYGKLNAYSALAKLLENPYHSEYERIMYDENFLVQAQEKTESIARKVVAVRFTPTRTGKLGGSTFFLGNRDGSNTDITIEVRKANGTEPGKVIASKKANPNNWMRATWSYIDLSDLNIQITSGEDFFISYNFLNRRGGSVMTESTKVDNRTFISNDGTNFSKETKYDAKIRAYVYEDQPQVKHLAEVSGSGKVDDVATGKNYIFNNYDLIARVEKDDNHSISGEVSAKVWVDSKPTKYVSRRYQIVPNNNAENASGKVTLYFTQAEFDAYNKGKAVQLPTSATDEVNKANVIIEKYPSNNFNENWVPNSNSNPVQIKVSPENVRWNDTYKYWEVTFENTGFGGFLIGTEATLSESSPRAEINIGPNPAKDIINVNIISNAKIEIYDGAGRLVKSFDGHKGNNPYNVSDLPKGYYVVNVTLENGKKVSEKIIKE